MTELSLLAAAQEAPLRDCLVSDGKVWSYAEVAVRVRTALAALRARGIESGDRVAVTPRVDVDSIVWLYALFELGCPAVLLHPRLSGRERAVALADAQPTKLIRGAVPEEAVGEGSVQGIASTAEQTLAVVYTSGSRGTPRGARLSRRAFLASEAAHAANLGWLPDERWLLSMPPAHVGGLSILTRSLIARRCVVLAPGSFDARLLSQVMVQERVTLLSLVPTLLRRLLMLERPAWTPASELRAALVGGATFPESLRDLAASRGVPALATYGCTETCSQVTTQSLAQGGRPGSGAPLQGIELRVEGEEIQVRGDVLMDGYLGGARAEDPWTPDGWLRTGDLGAILSDGQLQVRGRIDDLIVTGGENVAPQEVETWLLSVPGITGACVFPLPHEDWGEEVVAALAVDPARYSPEALRERLAAELAAHKRPKRVCVLDALPLNRAGKVDRAAVLLLPEALLGPI